jgi:hypothetical protein
MTFIWQFEFGKPCFDGKGKKNKISQNKVLTA